MASNAKKNTEELIERQLQRSTAKQWKSRSIGDDLELPSGNVALVRRVGPEAFLAGGVIPDALAPIVNEAIRSGQGLRPEKNAETGELDAKQIVDMLEMMDRVVVMAVLDPLVSVAPPCILARGTDRACGESPLATVHSDRSDENWHLYVGAERDDDIVYLDDVSFDDKSFIMQYAMGGTRDLERFRDEQSSSVESISNS